MIHDQNERDIQAMQTTKQDSVMVNGSLYVIHSDGSKRVSRSAVRLDGSVSEGVLCNPLPVQVNDPIVMGTCNRIYVIGDMQENTASRSVYCAAILPDHSLGGWRVVGSVPVLVYNAKIVVTSRYAYLVGSSDQEGGVPVAAYAAISKEGALTKWELCKDQDLVATLWWSGDYITVQSWYERSAW